MSIIELPDTNLTELKKRFETDKRSPVDVLRDARDELRDYAAHNHYSYRYESQCPVCSFRFPNHAKSCRLVTLIAEVEALMWVEEKREERCEKNLEEKFENQR